MKKLLGALFAALPALALAATPPTGVPLQVRRGLFAEADTGTFFTVGGLNGVSNAQPFLGFGLGYDVMDRFTLALHLDVGSSSGNCFTPAQDASTGECVDPSQVLPLSANFAVFGVSLQGRYSWELAERFTAGPKLVLGAATLTPNPIAGGASDGSDGFHALVGLGAGVQYATNLDHFTIGLDVEYRTVVGPNVGGIAIYPRIEYTF